MRRIHSYFDAMSHPCHIGVCVCVIEVGQGDRQNFWRRGLARFDPEGLKGTTIKRGKFE